MPSAFILLFCILNAVSIIVPQATGKLTPKLDECPEQEKAQSLTSQQNKAIVKLLPSETSKLGWIYNSQMEQLALSSLNNPDMHRPEKSVIEAKYEVLIGGHYTIRRIAKMAIKRWKTNELKNKAGGGFGCAYKRSRGPTSPQNPHVLPVCIYKFTCAFFFSG